MQIFLIYENKKFRLEYNTESLLQVKFLLSKLPKEDQSDEDKEYTVHCEDEVFEKHDLIDMKNYNNKEFFFIFQKKGIIKKPINQEDQTAKETKKQSNNINGNNNNNLTMAQMIKKITNAKEELKMPPKRKNAAAQSNDRDPYIAFFYNYHAFAEDNGLDVYSELDSAEALEEDYDSDLINADFDANNRQNYNQMIVDEPENSSSDMEVSVGNNNSSSLVVNENHLSQLVAMGFNAEMSELALRRSNNRIELAIEFLMFVS